jgi:glutamine amidotransferase
VEVSDEDLPLARFHPIGHTDSERVFCHVLDCILSQGVMLDEEGGWQWLYAKFSAVNRLGKFNCLMSDGERLFVYRDIGGWKGLNLRKVHIRSDQVRHLEDPGMGVDLGGSPRGNIPGSLNNHGFVVATWPLSRTGWHSLKVGELVVLEKGEIRFSSHRSGAR